MREARHRRGMAGLSHGRDLSPGRRVRSVPCTVRVMAMSTRKRSLRTFVAAVAAVGALGFAAGCDDTNGDDDGGSVEQDDNGGQQGNGDDQDGGQDDNGQDDG